MAKKTIEQLEKDVIKAAHEYYESMEDGGDDYTAENFLVVIEKLRKAKGMDCHE